MQKAKNTGMNGHIAKSRDINKLSEIKHKERKKNYEDKSKKDSRQEEQC